MRKVAVALVLLAATTAFAQEQEHTYKVGIGASIAALAFVAALVARGAKINSAAQSRGVQSAIVTAGRLQK